MFKTIEKPATAEFVEKKSRFITVITPISDEAAAKSFIADVKKAHPDSRHNCYAYRLFEPRIERFSDDGEPGGTAGMPILSVLKNHDLYNVLAVVTRYFGGILLGAGGLTRAYSRGAADAVKLCRMVTYQSAYFVKLCFDYGALSSIKHALDTDGVKVLKLEYGGDVTLTASVRADMLEKLQAAFKDCTRGTGRITQKQAGFDTF